MTAFDVPPLAAHPLSTMSLDEAVTEQFRLVETIARHFPKDHLLAQGDLGVAEPHGRPMSTAAVEACLADFFHAEDAVLVMGAGTGALRAAFFAVMPPAGTLVRHLSPVYETTAVTLRAMGVTDHLVDFHSLGDITDSVPADAALVGHARQTLQDSYELAALIPQLRRLIGDAPIIMDENYAVLKVARLGVELGADLSTFSAFKLFGPTGVGVVLGAKRFIDRIRQDNRSGGCQVQGDQAIEVLRGMVHVPVQAAVQTRVAREIAARLDAGEVPGITSAVMTNNAETIVLARLSEPVAPAFIAAAGAAGASSHPVGAESRYELVPLVYRVSKALLAEDPTNREWLIRINPNRGGADHCLDILRAAGEASRRGRP
jgi:hypothetical protein